MKCLFSLLALITTFSLHAGITIGAYNIRNFDYDERSRISTNKNELSLILKSLGTDVLSIEEVNNTAEFGRFVSSKMPGYDFEVSRCGGEHGQHLGFLFNKNTIELMAFTEDASISDPGGTGGGCNTGSRPMAIALFKIRATGQQFYGITVHLKSGGQAQSIDKRARQYQVMKKVINDLRAKTGIKEFYIAGDFNTTEYLGRGLDYKNLTQVVKELGMTDLTQNLACSAYWWGGSDDHVESPTLLDHIIVSPGLLKNKSAAARSFAHCQKVSCKEVPEEQLGISWKQVSDHCPITATIQ